MDHCNNLLWSELGHPGHVSSLTGENAAAQGECASHSSLQETTAMQLHAAAQDLEIQALGLRGNGKTQESKQGV